MSDGSTVPTDAPKSTPWLEEDTDDWLIHKTIHEVDELLAPEPVISSNLADEMDAITAILREPLPEM